jgi:FAD-NAD(P)-binding
VTEFAIVGLGSWGISVLERTVSRARRTDTTIRVHVVQPGELGGGVYSAEQPDYLVLNNACGQLSLYASRDDGEDRPYGIGLYDWAVQRGYRWVDYRCVVGGQGEAIRPTDYLPRRLMGEYLVWFYDTLVADVPPNLEIIRHHAAAVDIVPDAAGGERVHLDNGQVLRVEHVVLTSGHTINVEPPPASGVVRYQRAYPMSYFDDSLPAGAPVAIAGMGLVGYDLLTAFTVGRGGTYIDDGDRKSYVRSGREPIIYLYSRSGIPYCAKAAHGIDPYGAYQPVVCTPEEFAGLTNPGGSGMRRPVDFRNDLLPLLFAEMQARYHTHAATRRGGAEEADAVRRRLRAGWLDGHYDKVVEELEPAYGSFAPEDHVFAGTNRHYRSGQDYQAQFYEMVDADLDEALMVGGSPVKAAQETLRILRDQLRSVIEFGGLSLDSYIDFQANVRGRINRLEAGPPPLRSQQLLALLEAGVVRAPFGPAPEVSAMPDGRVALRSTQLDRLSAATVNGVVRGHLDLPSLARTASPMLRHMYTKGRLTQLTYGDTPVGSVAISENFHPFDAEGRVQPHLSLLGVLTEGVRYFTHYLPSPQSRLRAVLDAQACVERLID